MPEQIVHRKPMLIAMVALLQIMTPSAVAIGSLVCMMELFKIPFDRKYGVLTSIVMVLGALLLRPPKVFGPEAILARAPLVFSTLIRWGVIIAILMMIAYATKFSEDFSRRVIFAWALVTPAGLVVSALLLQQLLKRVLYDRSAVRLAVVAGYNETSQSLASRLRTMPEFGMAVAGFFDDRASKRLEIKEGIRLIGRLNELAAFVRANSVDVIFVALPIHHMTRVSKLLDEVGDTTASIYYVPDLFMFDLVQARTGDISGIPVVCMCETPLWGHRAVVKRLLDVVIAAVIVLIFMPLFVLIGILVKFSSPGPVIFKQRRYGLDGQEIFVYKFRTMTVMEDGATIIQATRGDSRVTWVGRMLRSTSLDELPQLINVLQGTMSLVGPRPHAVAHNEQYRKLIKGYMVRHKVLPGITGLAQVNGCRGETSMIEEMRTRVQYDLEYLRCWSPVLDLKILVLTAVRLFRDERAY